MIKNLKNILKRSKAISKLYNRAQSFKVSLNKRVPITINRNTIKQYNKTRKHIFIKNICHAPFTSLHIGIDGKYRVCCYNTEYVLGDIRQNSISEAWFGSRIKTLRKKISNFDFSAGCYLCEVQLKQGAFHTILAKNYDEFKNLSKRYPQIIEFELSNNCNLECIMCSEIYSSKIKQKSNKNCQDELKFDEDKFMSELVEFIPYLKKAKFTGGEPFLIKFYYRVWKLIAERNPKCEILIQTNGTILNEEIKGLLKNGKFNIIVSVDSLKKENFEHIRKNGNFDIFYNNLLWLINFCKLEKRYIGLTTCIMRQNWNEIPDIIKFCNENEISITFNKVYQPPACAIWGSSFNYIQKINQLYETIDLPSRCKIEYGNRLAFYDVKNLIKVWLNEAKHNEDFYLQYSNFDVEKIENMLFEKFNSVKNEDLLAVDKKNLLNTIQSSLSQYKSSSNYKKLLIELIKIPEEIIIREVSNNSQAQLMVQLENYLNKNLD